MDGHPQPIESVELQRVEAVPAGSTSQRVGADKRPAGIVPILSPPFTRHFVFLFDALNSERGLGSGAIQAARRFLQKGLPRGDEVMVAGQGRELKIYQEFTADPVKMLAALKTVESDPQIRTAGENRVHQNILAIREAEERCVVLGEGCSARMMEIAVEQAAVSAVQTDRPRILRSLASLRAIVSYLHSGTGRKELFYLTDGFPSDPGAFYGAPNEPGLESEILHLTREAAEAQVIIHTVNTQGIPLGTSMGDLRGLPDRPWESLIESEASDTLAALSLGTGGLAFHMSNKFEAALERVEEETRASYLVAYIPSGKPDGKFHSIQVKVHREGMRVRAEEGFLWMTDEENEERKIQSAYVAPELFHELPLAMEARSYLAADGHPAVQLAFAVPDQSLLFLPQQDRLSAQLDVGLTLRSDTGTIVDRFSQGIEVRLPLDSLAAHADLTLLAKRNVPPGEYDAVAVIRDQRSGEVGALRSRVKVPPLVGDRIAMSSLTLSSPELRLRRVDLDPETSRDPQIVIPAVRRAFSRDAEVVGSCLVYHPR
ncbi:MAG TPA: VWA domain-containing protein, partial [Myxococcales bacterium]